MKTPEREILRACLDYLRIQGHFVIRINCGAFQTRQGGFIRCTDIQGTADIIGCSKDGKFIAIECKSENGKQTKEQKMFEKNIKDRGALYIVARGIGDLQEAGL